MARCQWCTAPLPAGSALCRYCGRRNDLDLSTVHEFTVARPDSPRTCPACGIPMQTLDLGLGGTFYIERCERCLSLFFDPNEVETLLEKATPAVFEVDNRRLNEIAQGPDDGSRKVRYYPCPVCRTLMNRVNFGARSGVVVDRCPEHGMWLESGELRRLLEWKKAGGQIFDERRKGERAEEARREAERRLRELLRTRGEAGELPESGDLDIFGPVPASGAAARVFVRTVLKFFR